MSVTPLRVTLKMEKYECCHILIVCQWTPCIKKYFSRGILYDKHVRIMNTELKSSTVIAWFANYDYMHKLLEYNSRKCALFTKLVEQKHWHL